MKSKASELRRLTNFIEMYDKQDVLTVRECTGDEPADRYVGGQVAAKGYQVSHKTGEDDYNVYVCKTLRGASECVADIIFEIPMEGRVEEIENENISEIVD